MSMHNKSMPELCESIILAVSKAKENCEDIHDIDKFGKHIWAATKAIDEINRRRIKKKALTENIVKWNDFTMRYYWDMYRISLKETAEELKDMLHTGIDFKIIDGLPRYFMEMADVLQAIAEKERTRENDTTDITTAGR